MASKLCPSEPRDSRDRAQVRSKRRARQPLDPIFLFHSGLTNICIIYWDFIRVGGKKRNYELKSVRKPLIFLIKVLFSTKILLQHRHVKRGRWVRKQR